MSSSHNDLTQSTLRDLRIKEEMIESYKEKVQILEKIIEAKDAMIATQKKHIEELGILFKESMDQTNRIISRSNALLP